MQWPAGYSVAYALAVRSTGDVFLATTIIDILSGGVFFLAWSRIVLRARTRAAPRVAFAYWALAASAITFLPSSDALALAAYSAALALVPADASGSGWSAAASGLAAGVAGSVRFAYWPIAWVPIVPMLSAEPRRRRAARAAALYAVAAASPILWAAIVNRQAAGTVQLPGLANAASLLWRQVWPPPPFGAAALGVDVAWLRASVMFPWLHAILGAALWLVTAAVVGLAAVSASLAFAGGRDARAAPRALVVWFVLTFLVTTALVTTLTLRVPAYADGWTYMTDAARYLAPVYPFLVLFVADVTTDSPRLAAATAIALLTVCGLSVAAYRAGQAAFYVRRNSNVLPSGAGPRREARMVIDAVRRSPPANAPPLYCDPNARRRAMATIAGAAALPACPGADAANGGERRLQARVAANGALVEIVGR